MNIIKIHRTWKTDTKRRFIYWENSLTLFGIPIVQSKRTRLKQICLFGIPIYQKRIHPPQSDHEHLRHALNIITDVHHLPPASGLLRIIQLASLRLLKRVDAVCKKHGITYWLNFGTLLGAVRHKGFIPWDDDIDISMMRCDYEKFLSILDEEFSTNGFSYDNWGSVFIHYKNLPIHVDINPIDQAPDKWFPEGEQEAAFVDKRWDVLAQLTWDIDLEHDQRDSVISHTYEERRQLHDRLVMNHRPPLADGNLFFGTDSVIPENYTLMYDWVFPLGEIPFEDMKLPCPQRPEMVLFSHFGDWEEIPKNPVFHIDRNALSKADLAELLDISQNGFPDDV